MSIEQILAIIIFKGIEKNITRGKINHYVTA